MASSSEQVLKIVTELLADTQLEWLRTNELSRVIIRALTTKFYVDAANKTHGLCPKSYGRGPFSKMTVKQQAKVMAGLNRLTKEELMDLLKNAVIACDLGAGISQNTTKDDKSRLFHIFTDPCLDDSVQQSRETMDRTELDDKLNRGRSWRDLAAAFNDYDGFSYLHAMEDPHAAVATCMDDYSTVYESCRDIKLAAVISLTKIRQDSGNDNLALEILKKKDMPRECVTLAQDYILGRLQAMNAKLSPIAKRPRTAPNNSSSSSSNSSMRINTNSQPISSPATLGHIGFDGDDEE